MRPHVTSKGSAILTTPLDELFDRQTKHLGGRFPWERMDAQTRTGYQLIVDRVHRTLEATQRDVPTLPPIHFAIVYHGAVNAWAFKAEGQYFIGVSTGTLELLRLVTGRMLAHPRTFGPVGNPTIEADLGPLVGYVPDAEVMVRLGVKGATPRDDVRHAFALYLEHLALDYVLAHEAAHIIRGHVDYLGEGRRLGFLAPVRRVLRSRKARRLERQCLEVDADRYAIFTQIQELGRKSTDGWWPEWSPGTYPPESLLADWAAAWHVFQNLFAPLASPSSRPLRSTHPPIDVRRKLGDNAAVEACLHYLDPSPGVPSARNPRTWKALWTGSLRAEQAFAILQGRKPLTDWVPFLEGKSRAHQELLAEHWNGVVGPSVEHFAHV